jgi:lipopolysaccharide/colanic/teichoic acid biosynthesis glycosyltransferase
MAKVNSPGFPFIGVRDTSVLWPDQAAPAAQSQRKQRGFEGLDDRTARMLDFIMNEEFKTARASNHIRLKLTFWVIRNKINAQLKRIFDIIFAACALIGLSPIFLITAIAIKLDSSGPIFYRQVRGGERGKLFGCLKFRSMIVNADAQKQSLMAKNEADEIVFKMKKDPRVTRVGRIIRKLSIDELPQFINVLKGDMSIVGPRPPVPSEVEKYQFQHYYRLDAVPGITGLQQVEGRSGITFKRWVQLDLEYIQEQSLRKDLLIILKTIPAVVLGRGAY